MMQDTIGKDKGILKRQQQARERPYAKASESKDDVANDPDKVMTPNSWIHTSAIEKHPLSLQQGKECHSNWLAFRDRPRRECTF